MQREASTSTAVKSSWTKEQVYMLLEHIQTNWAELKDKVTKKKNVWSKIATCLLYTSPSPRD